MREERSNVQAAAAGYVTVATVVRAPGGPEIVVRAPSFGTLAARLALAGPYEPRADDIVLVAADEHGNRYVVGVVRALREARAVPWTTEEGATVLRAPEGRLVLEAERIELRGTHGVTIGCERDIAIDAKGRVDLATRDAEGTERSGIHLAGDAAELRAGRLTAKAAHLHALAAQATLIAKRADTYADEVRQHAERIEVRASEIVERAKDTYRTVENLAQVHAGRLRLVAESTLHTLAERMKLRAKGTVSVDGEKIYLG